MLHWVNECQTRSKPGFFFFSRPPSWSEDTGSTRHPVCPPIDRKRNGTVQWIVRVCGSFAWSTDVCLPPERRPCTDHSPFPLRAIKTTMTLRTCHSTGAASVTSQSKGRSHSHFISRSDPIVNLSTTRSFHGMHYVAWHHHYNCRWQKYWALNDLCFNVSRFSK